MQALRSTFTAAKFAFFVYSFLSFVLYVLILGNIFTMCLSPLFDLFYPVTPDNLNGLFQLWIWTHFIIANKGFSSYDMKVVTKEWSMAENNPRLSWDSNPVCPDKNPVPLPLSQTVNSLTQLWEIKYIPRSYSLSAKADDQR